MGADIHIITEIFKNGKWNNVEEIPEKLDERNYHTFSFLANVRNSFNTKGFDPKGLPEDISGRKFLFHSESARIKERYYEETKTKVKLPNGELISKNDKSIAKKVYSREEADKYNGWSYDGSNQEYTVWDPSLVNGELVEIPIQELMTMEEWMKTFEDDWDEDAQDYGYWQIDFDCADYHSHSWLTLKELKDSDKTDYLSTKVKISKLFYDKFIEFGGVLPEEMTVLDATPSDICEVLRYAFNPEVIISFMDETDKKESPLIMGINQLEEIAKKYDVSDENIRIVFAFDN